MSETYIIKKEDPDKKREDKKESWIKNSFFLRHFLCLFVFILLIIYIYLSYKKGIRAYFFLSNLKVILPALITAAGVFEGFNINRKKSFKEIVTKERIDWLHKMQENLSEYLVLTSSGNAKNIDKDKVTELYYKIIFSINHEKDKEALAAIKNYHSLILGEPEKIFLNLALTQDKKIELLAVPGGEDELLFKIKDKSERDKLNGLIEDEKLKDILIGEVKFKNKNKGKDKKEKDRSKEISLLRKEVSEEFTEIFKKVWEDIKEEAD